LVFKLDDARDKDADVLAILDEVAAEMSGTPDDES
jgi:hypothetical protein